MCTKSSIVVKIFCISFITHVLAASLKSEEISADRAYFEFPKNLTYSEISTLLEQHGYEVIENPGGAPLARTGDIVYLAEQVLPELAPAGERGATQAIGPKHLWLDKNDKAQVPYFFDTKTKANQKLFNEAVNAWSKSTCVTFTKLADGECSKKASHGGICVQNSGNCWSMIGNIFSFTKAYQQLSIGDLCELYAAVHEMGHALGMHHTMARTDRDSFISVNYENFEVKFDSKISIEASLKKDWSQGAMCKKGQGFESSTPLPYDYRSVMQYGQSDFGDDDYRMIFAAKDPRYQYMFDYSRSGGYLQSHYDLLLINTIYKCSKKWAAACKSPPKCQNHGYLQKDCKCACAAGFQGASCEKKHGSLFPPLDRAKALIDDHRAGYYNFKKRGMHTNNHNYPLSRFIYYQYATMYLRGRDKTTMVSVRVFEPEEVAQSYSMKAFQVSSFFTDMNSRDCEYGMLFYWGDYSRGRVRTECISTFITNEPKSNALMLRAKTNVVGIVIIGKLGEFFPYAEFTKWMIEMLQFRVWFLTRPQSKLKLLQSKGGPKVVIGASTTTEQTVLGAGAMAAAKALGHRGTLALAVGVPVALLTLAAVGGGLYWWRSRKKRPPRTLQEKLFDMSSESSCSSSDDD